jgi:hypothetical protein
MALKIKVEFSGVDYFTINNSACWTVSTPIGFPLALRKEPNMMSFTNDDDSDSRLDV